MLPIFAQQPQSGRYSSSPYTPSPAPATAPSGVDPEYPVLTGLYNKRRRSGQQVTQAVVPTVNATSNAASFYGPPRTASPTVESTSRALKRPGAAGICDGVDVRPSTIKAAGRGLFATRRFDVGDLITEYGGIVISCEEAKKRREAGKASHIRTLDSMYTAIDGLSVTVATGNPGGSFANDPHRGDVKEKPNRWNATFVKLEHRQQIGLRLCERGGLQALARIFLKAVRVILPNDEIFVNYGRGYWDRTQTGDTEESASDE